MIDIKNLSKKFGEIEVLKDLNLEITKGGVFAILGPNGSGKTTLIKSFLGMIIPDKGTIDYNGKSVLGEWEYRTNISYLPQIANFPNNLTVSELINMVKNLRNKDTNEDELIDLFKIEKFKNKKLGVLSGGTKQKVNLVLSFMVDTDIIILDEPTTGLDPVSVISLKELIEKEKNKGKTILITSHIINFVEEVSDDIIFLLDGKIYFKGSIALLKEQTNNTNLEMAIANLILKQYD
ncbi:ABC transporter ATP-binding protein [Flammeovirga pectinis]|uniref:ABC transporter ATP-binding protein n=1 Tax=Flammeovirga pectinis TaxID=2494373 RepID=A0A3Q9FLC7_9BACT|nr:ABC transporter ATP-binding protein [Flammeovirga pectinis]AZQ60852.1 ABC transporter ATP-binding protein [Flammeovirga pectinis]